MAADPRPPDPNRPPQSFRDVVVRPTIPIMESTEQKVGSLFKGEPALQFSQEEIAKLAAPFDHTLIGKFALQRPSLAFLRKGFQLIGFTGDVDIGVLDTRHVLLRFSHREDYYRVWMRGSWNFKQHVMRILKWTPEFTCHQEPAIVPVWVAFSHLPIHLFQQGPLLSLASLIGRPLRIDTATKNLSRPSTARVCIEVNLLRSLPKRIWIGHGDTGFWQPVHYESLPQYCTQCFSIGHATLHCTIPERSNPEEEHPINKQIWKKKETASGSGLTDKDKESIPTDIPSAVITPPATLASNAVPQAAVASTTLDTPTNPRVDAILIADAPRAASTAVPIAATLRVDAVASEVTNPKVDTSRVEILHTQVAPGGLTTKIDVILEDDTDSMENDIPDKSPLARSASATFCRLCPQEDADEEATMSQPDGTDEEGEWNQSVPRRLRKKKDYGRSTMITRSQESPSNHPDV